MSDQVYNLKLALERHLRNKLKAELNSYLLDWGQATPSQKLILRAEYSSKVAERLRRHFYNVQTNFKNAKATPRKADKVRILGRARDIIERTDTIMNEAQQAILLSQGFSSSEASQMATQIGRKNLRVRIPAIANMETNGLAEVLRREDAIIDASGGKLLKSWSSKMDGKERASHHAAHMIYNGFKSSINIHEPYIIGGYRLMYPGDTNNGAVIGETINCRCKSEFFDESGNHMGDTTRGTARRVAQDGDEVGREIEGNPTISTTLTDGIRNRVVLADKKLATVIREGNEIRVIRGRTRLGTATLSRSNGKYRLDNVSVTNQGQNIGVEGLVQRSIDEFNIPFNKQR